MSLINLAPQGAGLVKTSGCNGCPDASAVSAEQIAGMGTLDFVASETATLRFVGLGSAGAGAGASDIQFAIRLQNGTAEVRESGSYRSETSFGAGDHFTISVENGVVRYARNGSVFYTSSSSAGFAVRVHAVFFDVNASVANLAISGGGGAAASAPAPPPVAVTPEAPVVEEAQVILAPGERYAIPRPRKEPSYTSGN
jgi:hypothetical protein